MSDILQDTDFNQVRTLAQVDSTTVPNSTLGSFTHLEMIEALVKDGVTDWATHMANTSSQDRVYLRSGTAHLLAAKIASEMKANEESGAGFRVGGYSESTKKIEWDAVVDDLIRQAKVAFSSISTRTFNRRTALNLSGPTSSGAIVPDDFEGWIDRILPRVLDWEEEGGEDDAVYP